ncbi:MAG: hypothetical protein KIT33_11220 [Candidatus Kapabacteria bacterium]|nr:hypothetical protein [Candidatus Kapabacteria bacterium]
MVICIFIKFHIFLLSWDFPNELHPKDGANLVFHIDSKVQMDSTSKMAPILSSILTPKSRWTPP